MSKILVVFTGGTIGSVEVGGVKEVEQAKFFSLIETYKRRNPESKVQFEVQELTPKVLSENITIGIWNRMIDLIKGIKFDDYDGVIITHGTDTLAYTAALFSVLLKHVKVPVILVSSNEMLASPTANGHKNFEDSVSFICKGISKLGGVFAAFSYDLKKTMFYLGKHITQSEAFIHRYGSYAGVDFGYMESGVFSVANVDAAGKLWLNGWDDSDVLSGLEPLENCVLQVRPYIGLDYSRINLDGVRAVLHGTYHSFSMCLDEKVDGKYPEEPSVTSVYYLYKKCMERGIAFYFSSFDSSLVLYDTTRYMVDKGAAFILDSSVELAYAGLVIGHNIQKENGVLGCELRDSLGIRVLKS